MAGKSHDMEPTGQHPPGSCPVDETMPLFSSDVLDDEERSVLSNLKILNPSLADVSASSSLSTEVPSISPLSEIDKQLSKPPSGLVPPVTCISLALMEERMTPPSLSICHELAFDAKAKVSLHQVKYSSNEQASREHEYWIFLRQELISLTEGSIIPTLLPQLLAEIKNMILYLYPESKAISQQLIHDTDANLIVQEIRMGSLDANSFAESLSKLLKANCAPKRDPLVDHLVTLGRGGNWIGLFKSCLDLMELMKLVLRSLEILSRCNTFLGFNQLSSFAAPATTGAQRNTSREATLWPSPRWRLSKDVNEHNAEVAFSSCAGGQASSAIGGSGSGASRLYSSALTTP